MLWARNALNFNHFILFQRLPFLWLVPVRHLTEIQGNKRSLESQSGGASTETKVSSPFHRAVSAQIKFWLFWFFLGVTYQPKQRCLHSLLDVNQPSFGGSPEKHSEPSGFYEQVHLYISLNSCAPRFYFPTKALPQVSTLFLLWSSSHHGCHPPHLPVMMSQLHGLGESKSSLSRLFFLLCRFFDCNEWKLITVRIVCRGSSGTKTFERLVFSVLMD